MDGEDDKQKTPEGGEGGRVKRKMKTASQLELLEKTYAMDTYPSETVRAELSGKLGLTDRQLQMWFCHRRLKDRKPPATKRPRKDANAAGSSGGGGIGDEVGPVGEVGNELASGPGSGSSPFGHVDLQRRMVVPRIATNMPAMKRYYEPPQAISELRAIAFVEAQLGEQLREDGPILGMEFDPLPPGAFGTPIVVTAGQQKPAGRLYDVKLYERSDAKPIKGTVRDLHEYQFLPEQPSVRNDTYERAVPSHFYGSPAHPSSLRTPISAYGFQGPLPSPSLSLLPQQGRQGHLLPSTPGDYDTATKKHPFPSIGVDGHFVAQSITGMESPFIPSDTQVTHDEDNLRRKRKSDEARITKEVEAHEKRIRKELEKQDILRRKREEQMRKEMERQDRERRKEEERLLREKQREEERYQREQRRELERREKFLQKESVRAEKLRLKEEMRREKEAARLKAATERATARKIAKESMELLDDERVELMDIAASKKGLPTILALDSETLQNLDLFRDMLTEFPPKSVCLKRPFTIQPWTDSEDNIGNLLMVWRFLITFADVLGVWPFTMDEFVQAFHDYDPRLLGEIHVALLRCIIKDIEDVARTPFSGFGTNQSSAANPGGGHPHIVEGAYAWGFDIRSWQSHLNPLTWPEVLRQFAISVGFGPKLKTRSIEQAYLRDENEGNDGEDVISNLRNGAAAENALAIMQERGLSNPRRPRHRLTPGTVKFAAFHVLSFEGSKGLSILDVADKIQKSGLRDLTTSKTPEASIAAALSRDTKLFERTAPSTYCVRAPYRKDPADADALLTAAREKIQELTNGILDGEEAEDVERDEVERDEDYESDVAEDPEVDDIGTILKPSKESLISSGKGKEIPQEDITGTSQDQGGPEDLKDVKGVGASLDRSVDAKAAIPCQEDNVIDESQLGEPWVQGLMEGEYSDLSVEERLNALVALIGVANEGNSIRIVLEDRLEAANVLKKQMWAEAQVDKRRMKEDYVMKIQYPSSVVSQSPLFAVDDKSDLASTNHVVKNEHLGDPNHPNNVPTERSLSAVQEFSVGPDNNNPLQQAGYAAEKTRSQLKAIIGHKAEEMYVYRSLPLGQDRRRNRYWQFITSASRNDPGSGRIFVQLRDDRWRLIDSEKGFDALLASLDVRGVRESQLLPMLQMIETTFKETVSQNSCAGSWGKVEDAVKTEVSELGPDPDCSAGSTDSPSSTVYFLNSDVTESSSTFKIELGRNEREKKEALKRYQEFEKWIWEECFNSSILRATKYGKIRSKQLFGVCDVCRDLYFVKDNHCLCHGSPDVLSSSPPHRIRLLKAQISLVEASIPVEALEPVWSDDYRKSWGMKLQTAASAEDLLQVLTLLEGGIKRDFLLPDYETTSELLVSVDSTGCKTNNSSLIPETIAVLPWLPQTTSSVALRLMELDSSIFYLLSQKEDSQRDKVSSDVMTVAPRSAVGKNISEVEVAEASHEATYLHEEPWITPASGPISSARGRGRGRGRSCTRGGRSHKRVTSSRSEGGPKSTTPNTDGFGQLVGWKGGRTRGRGGRKRGRRSARNKQKPVKRVKVTAPERENNTKDTSFERTPTNYAPNWNVEETPFQVESPENSSSSEFQSEADYDDNNGQSLGDEYDDLTVDNYPGAYNGNIKIKPENFRQVNYGDEDYDVHVDEEEEEDDDDVIEDEQEEDVDVERYFNGYSDEERNRDMNGKQIGNPDDITESSSSEYSD